MPILQFVWRSLRGFPFKLWTVICYHGLSMGLGFIFFYYCFGYLMFLWVEPLNSPLRHLDQYSWYFMVTISTVGYGDTVPISWGGKIVAGGMIWTCIGAFGVVIGQLAAKGSEISAKARKGLMNLNLKNHIVIIGYHPDRTQRIHEQIVSDQNRELREIVLCFSGRDTDEHPLPGDIRAVRGTLDSDDVMNRACIQDAAKVLIDTGVDEMTMSVALAVVAHNPNVQIVAGLKNMLDGPKKMARVSSAIECAHWEDFGILVQALQDPGTAKLLQTLTMNDKGNEFYRLDIPLQTGTWQFGELLVYFKKNYNATLIGIATRHDPLAPILENPAWDHLVRGGNSLMYIANQRLLNVKYPG